MGVADDGALSLSHVGFGFDAGDLVGSVSGGSSQTTTTLINGVSSGAYPLRAEYDSVYEARFYANGKPLESIQSGLPQPGGGEKDRLMMAFVNNSSSTDRYMDIDSIRFAQAPESRFP